MIGQSNRFASPAFPPGHRGIAKRRTEYDNPKSHLSFSPMRLLLVEDHSELARWLLDWLTHSGYIVEHLNRGDQADLCLLYTSRCV